MMTLLALYGEIVANERGEKRTLTWSQKDLRILERNVNDFSTMFVELFDKHYETGLYSLKLPSRDHYMGINEVLNRNFL